MFILFYKRKVKQVSDLGEVCGNYYLDYEAEWDTCWNKVMRLYRYKEEESPPNPNDKFFYIMCCGEKMKEFGKINLLNWLPFNVAGR
jgi:hypothetical protein